MKSTSSSFPLKQYLLKHRFYPFREYLKEHFAHKVHKIPIHAGFTCPNRDGRVAVGGCTYCINESFSPNVKETFLPVREQIERGKEFHKKRYGAEKFIAYFQSFTNTYADIDTLKSCYEEALSDRDVVGISIGTRPDCITDDILSLIDGYTKRYHVWIEYGLQSIHDKTLRRINRGHDSRMFLDAVHRTKNTCINICVHVILGLPGETEEEMMETAQAVAGLGIQGIKLHHLYVAKNTALAEEYFQGKVKTLDMNAYIKLAVSFLERTPSDVTVQRLVGDTHGNFLLSPVWKASKAEITDGITQEFERRGTYQGLRHIRSVPLMGHPNSCSTQTLRGQNSEEFKLHTVKI